MTDDERQAQRRERQRAYKRAYYQANRDKIAEHGRAYYQANRDKIAEHKRAYYQGQKARAALETASVCDRCGISFERCRRVPGTNLCMDCGED